MYSDVEPSPETTAETTTEAPEQAPVKYYISMDWYDSVGRSFAAVAEGRMCASCQAKLGTEVETRVPTLDTKGTRVVFETRRVAYGSNPVAIIRDCCSRSKGYVMANMPLMEVAFRVLLAAGNQPMTLEEIAQQVEEHVTYAGGSRMVNADALRRMLDNDDYYGFAKMQVP